MHKSSRTLKPLQHRNFLRALKTYEGAGWDIIHGNKLVSPPRLSALAQPEDRAASWVSEYHENLYKQLHEIADNFNKTKPLKEQVPDWV